VKIARKCVQTHYRAKSGKTRIIRERWSRCPSRGGASLHLSPEGRTFTSCPTASPINYANPNYNENKPYTKEQHCAQLFGYQHQRFGNWFRVEEQEYSDNCPKNPNINHVSDPSASV